MLCIRCQAALRKDISLLLAEYYSELLHPLIGKPFYLCYVYKMTVHYFTVWVFGVYLPIGISSFFKFFAHLPAGVLFF